MEHSGALRSLLEAADLLTMLEELAASSGNNGLSPASQTGMRLTLKNVKDLILSSHDILAHKLISYRTEGQLQPEIERSVQVDTGEEGNSEKSLGGASQRTLGKEGVLDQKQPFQMESSRQTFEIQGVGSSGVHFRRKDLRSSLEKLIEKP